MRDGELIRKPEEPPDPTIPDLIPDAAALLATLHVAAPAQAREVGRDAGLGKLEQFDQLADRALPIQQELEDAQPRGITKTLEEPGAGFDCTLRFA